MEVNAGSYESGGSAKNKELVVVGPTIITVEKSTSVNSVDTTCVHDGYLEDVEDISYGDEKVASSYG